MQANVVHMVGAIAFYGITKTFSILPRHSTYSMRKLVREMHAKGYQVAFMYY